MSHTNWSYVQECIDDLRHCRSHNQDQAGTFNASERDQAIKSAASAMDAALTRGYATADEEEAAALVCRVAERNLR